MKLCNKRNYSKPWLIQNFA